MAGQQELVEQLFDAALAIKPGDRHSFLEGVCGGDLELRRSVEYLLVKDPRAGSSPHDPPPGFLDKTTVDIVRIFATARKQAATLITLDRRSTLKAAPGRARSSAAVFSSFASSQEAEWERCTRLRTSTCKVFTSL